MTTSTTIQLKIVITVLKRHLSGGGNSGCSYGGGGGGGGGGGCGGNGCDGCLL